jgi:hypothetical protein
VEIAITLLLKVQTLATKEDKIYLYMGLIFACITGLGLPSFVFLVGDVINSFDPSVSRAEALKTMLKILYIFIGIGIE